MTGDEGLLRRRERLGAVTATGLDAAPDPAMDRLAGLVARLLGADVSLVSLVDGARQFFPGQHGLASPWSASREAPLSQSICRLVVQSGATVRVDDTATDDRLVGHEARPVLGVGSYLGVPLTDSRGNVLGSLCAIDGGARRWSDEDERLLADLAFGASSELRARIATTVATQATERVQLMADASMALDASLDPRRSLAGMLDIVVPAFATWALLWARPEPHGRPLAVARHVDPVADAHLRQLAAGDLAAVTGLVGVGAVLGDEVAARALDPAEAHGLAEHLAGPDGAEPFLGGGVMVVPVVDRRERSGILLLGATGGLAELSALDQALAVDLGHRAGTALRNARAYDHERHVATTLQRSLLPTLPEVDGLDLWGAYEPASAGAEVGGDWYDVLALADGSVAVTIGDVTGHSMDAAATMGRLSGAIGCYSHDGLGPAAVLARLDGQRDHLLGGMFATCACLRLRPRRDGWAVTLSNAGHLPPVVVAPPGGEVPAAVVEMGRGPLLGPYAAPTRVEGEAHLPWGAILVLCTDGLVERRTETIDQSLERLRHSAETVDPTVPLEDFCAKLIADLRPDGDDDTAVLCLRATPPPSTR